MTTAAKKATIYVCKNDHISFVFFKVTAKDVYFAKDAVKQLHYSAGYPFPSKPFTSIITTKNY